ncbi:hypothetical protein JCM3765_003823 [Sporobolomyces pararoseus]
MVQLCHVVGLSQKTFASLALASKRFLPFAQLNLYYRPIPPSPVTWKTGISLIESLKSTSCPPSLSTFWSPPGELVVSLEGIVDFVSEIGTLKEPRGPLSFQLPRHTETFSLYYGLLKACTQLAFLELIFYSTEHLSRLSIALEASTSTLKTLKFKNSEFEKSYQVATGLARIALGGDRFKGIENLICDEIHVYRWVDAPPSTDLPLKSISIMASRSERDFPAFRILFPRNSSTLVSVSLQGYRLSRTDLACITEYLPTTLKRLTLSSLRANDHRSIYDPITSLPPFDLNHFPALTHLSLRGYDVPSLSLLEQLASSSPLLNSIDFSEGKWVSDSPLPKILEPSPTKISAALDRFEKLRNIDLGFFHSSRLEEWTRLKEEIWENKKIRVSFTAFNF